MNILERGKAFVESLRALAARTAWAGVREHTDDQERR